MAVQFVDESPHAQALRTIRSVVVVDSELPKGFAANVAAVLAMTLGARTPQLIGDDFEDGAGQAHPGLIATGLPILGAAASEFPALRVRALERELLVVDLPAAAHTTNDYDVFRDEVGRAPELEYLGVLISGPRRAVRSVTGQFGLLR
jgi:hypothetical protein